MSDASIRCGPPPGCHIPPHEVGPPCLPPWCNPTQPPERTLNGTSGNDLVHISKAEGLAGCLGLYKVDINGQCQYMTKQQLENTNFKLGKGNDVLVVDPDVNANIKCDGGDGNDLLIGGKGNDCLSGGKGNDIIFGGAGNDKIDGGKGNDWLFGGCGDDTIRGGKGNDHLYGGRGDDTIRGNQGRDVCFGGPGRDDVRGGKGRDAIFDFVALPFTLATQLLTA